MLIAGTALTDIAPTSATVNPTATTSVFGVVGNYEGTVSLQAKFPGSSKWFNLATTSKDKMMRVSTPNSEIDYRVTSQLRSGTATVYFG